MSRIIKISAVAAAVAITFSATSTIAATTFDKAYGSETSNIKQYSRDKTQKIKTRYIVQLEDEPLATYRGGVVGLMATSSSITGDSKVQLGSKAAVQYKSYLKAKQKQLSRSITQVNGARVSKSFDTLFNGVVVEGQPGQLAELSSLPGVKKVFLDTEYHAVMDASIDVIKGVEAWQALGGQSNAGKGIKVAVIDSGIRPENPMFSADGFSEPEFTAEQQQYLTEHPDYCRISTGEADFCNNKLIVARAFGPTPASIHPDEYLSPLGYDGHGTHVAGTAVGNPVEITYQGSNLAISGVAPAAQLLAYKALYHTSDDRASGTTSALMSALEAAIADGADVINNSWGGGAGGNPATSAYADLFKAAEEAGVVVVTAAGNDGNAPQTIGCPSCIESGLTVANTQTGRFFSQTVDFAGQSYMTTEGSNELLKSALELPMISAQVIAPDNFEGCEEFAEGISFADSIALISRGTCSFSIKAANAEKAGAKAVIIHNNVPGGAMGMDMGGATIPAVAVSQDDGEKFVELLTEAEDVLTARLDPTVTRTIIEKFTDAVNSSSSRGPNGEPNFLKPDIAAPGTDIVSAFSPDEGNGITFSSLTGTSMASPHVAGAAALMKQQHPQWNAVQIKTALMSTSKMDGLRKEDLVTKADPFDVGAGRLDMPSSFDAALTFGHGSYADPSCIGVCSFSNTMTNMLDEAGEWSAKVVTDMAGAEISVSPSVINLGALGSEDKGDTAEFNLDIDTTFNSVKGWNFGHVVWTHTSGKIAHLPFAIYDDVTNNASVFKVSVDADSLNYYTPAKVNVEFNNTVYSDEIDLTVELDASAELVSGSQPLATVTNGSGEITLSDDKKTINWQGVVSREGFAIEAEDFLGTTSLADFDIEPYACVGECDEFSVAINANFIFDGREYSSFTVSDNGFIAVGDADTTNSFSPQMMPDAATPNGVIAPLWADFDLAGGTSGGGQLYLGTLSNEAGDVFYIVEWHNAELYGGTGEQYTFQVIITEGTDEIRINYIDVPQLPSDYSAGVESADGVIGARLEDIPTGTGIGKGYVINKTPGGSVAIDFQAFAKDLSHFTANDSVVVDEEQTITIDVLANDLAESRFVFDAKASSDTSSSEFFAHKGARIEGRLEASTVKVITQPSNGIAVVNDDGTIDYTPKSQFSGEDSFTYTVREASGKTAAETTVAITVNDTIAPPQPPAPEIDNGSSGSLGWLVLLATPFTMLRRRIKKESDVSI